MSKSIERVRRAAEAAGLSISILRMDRSTRTAEDAANACGCDVAQIAKSLIFEGSRTGTLKLLLVSGRNRVDLDKVAAAIGEPLQRADAKRVRDITGFAIGGVAPIGHLTPIETWIDEDLMAFDTVWAAAGAPDAVFETTPATLQAVTSAHPLRVA